MEIFGSILTVSWAGREVVCMTTRPQHWNASSNRSLNFRRTFVIDLCLKMTRQGQHHVCPLAINQTTLQMCYNAEDLLPLCEELDVPLVFGEILYV